MDQLQPPWQHPAFEPPSNPQIRIWRYMDFTQLVSMLEEGGLLFTRGDLLEDKFEGTMSRPTYKFLKQHAQDPQEHAGLLRLTKAWSYVNCWHMSEHESAAMWKVYSTTKESVSIQSTYLRLRAALDNDIYIGEIKYIYYELDKIPPDNTFFSLMHKRRSFEYERELRAVWSALHRVADAGPAVASGYEFRPADDPAVWKKVNFGQLIENVYVSPTAKPWFLALVKRVLNRYQLRVSVCQSDLAAEPLS